MTKFIKFGGLIFAASMLFGCRSAEEPPTANIPEARPVPSNTPVFNPPVAERVDVPGLAGKTAAEIDKLLGPPEEVKPIENNGEYRLYKLAGQPKGLAVRFYGGRAKSFNLILTAPEPTSKEALRKFFAIDVGNLSPLKNPKEPLSEKYQGTFGGVKFSTVSAKKQENGKGFIFVLAEIDN
jgi:hypothetical protein